MKERNINIIIKEYSYDELDPSDRKLIEAGMHIRFDDGSVELVYATVDAYGNDNLGINASNEEYMKRHGLGEYDREFYPLSNFRMSEVEIVPPDQI